MENEHSGLNALEFEKAIALASCAAVAWCQRTADDDHSKDCYLAPLMKAAAWVSRVRRNYSLPPLDLPEMIEALSQPVSMWLPGGDEMELIHEGEATPICHEYADSAGINPEQEIEQGIMRHVMNNLIGDASGTDKYSSFRKFLVENAHVQKKEAAAAVQSVRVDLSRIYKPIPTASRVTLKDGQEHFFPCPRCKWPMPCCAV